MTKDDFQSATELLDLVAANEPVLDVLSGYDQTEPMCAWCCKFLPHSEDCLWLRIVEFVR